jgi:photosystem II stability/assembly factor-like uncharacterized protein
MPLPEIFVDLDSVVFIQEDGPCSGYAAMACHAIDSTSIGRTDAPRVYCKDPGKRGERAIARTVPGRKEPGTLTINAWSQAQSDLLHRIWQKNCMFGAQTHLDVCGLPTDITAYTKILDYYGIMPGTLDYSNMDNLEGGEGTGLQLALSCTYDDLIEVLKVAIDAVPATEVTVTEPMMCIAGDLTERCASDCGVDRDRCEIIISCTNFLAGPAVAQCWYSTDSGVNWAATANAPFTPDVATVAIGACCIVEDRWIAFLGALFAGLAGRCAITDDRGVTAWTAVDMGGGVGADYVTSCYVYSAGSIWACGGEAGPNGHVWYSTDRGETWTMSEDIVAQILRDIATADGDTIYAVGDANTVMKSTDTGATWTALTGPASSSAFDLLAVRALTNDHVLVGGAIDANSEQLWCTLDGGETWTAMTFTGSTTAATRVASLDLAPQAPKQHVWMVQGLAATTNDNYVFRSLDGGYTWERWPVEANDRYNEIFACDSNHAWIAGDDDGVGGAGQVHYAAPVS